MFSGSEKNHRSTVANERTENFSIEAGKEKVSEGEKEEEKGTMLCLFRERKIL